MREICVKKFDHFGNRQFFDFKDKHLGVFDAQGEKWKLMRKALTPTFTSGKLKKMLQPIENVGQALVDHLNENYVPGKTVDMKPIMQNVAIGSICHCAFGIDTNLFKNEGPSEDLKNLLVETISGFRVTDNMTGFFTMFLQALPELTALALPFTYPTKCLDACYSITKNILDSRDKESHRGDFIETLQELLGSEKFNPDYVLAQGSLFFLAGFETAGNCLSTLMYNLAKHPKIQDKLYEEITEVMDDRKLDYETLSELRYLEATIQENLRMYPPAIFIDRVCEKDVTLSNGMHIKAGTIIQFPYYGLNHCEDNFPEPENFNPERYLEENAGKDWVFSFGMGPRVCIGSRFAMSEMKMALAKLILEFRILDSPETKLEFYGGDVLALSFPEIKIILEKR